MLKAILISFRVKATALLGHPQPRRCPPSLATGTSAPSPVQTYQHYSTRVAEGLSTPKAGSPSFFSARRSRSVRRVSSSPAGLRGGEGPQGSDGADGEEDPREEQRQEDSTHGSWYTKIVGRVVDAVTVKERGDFVDTTLVSLSIAVYVYMSMQLWRVYAHLVAMGQPDPFL